MRKKEESTVPTKKELDSIKTEFEKQIYYSWPNPVSVYRDGEIVHEFNDFQGLHAFWKNVADKYNLEYYTNFGVYDGVDAYIDYYYPEQKTPEAPTSHRKFKL